MGVHDSVAVSDELHPGGRLLWLNEYGGVPPETVRRVTFARGEGEKSEPPTMTASDPEEAPAWLNREMAKGPGPPSGPWPPARPLPPGGKFEASCAPQPLRAHVSPPSAKFGVKMTR